MLKFPDTDEEKGLYDLWQLILRHSLLILLTTFIFAVIGFFTSFSQPKIWEGSIVMKIGQVGDLNLIEPIPTIVSRIQHPTFLTKTIEHLKIPNEQKINTYSLLKESIRINMLDYYNTIEIKLRSYSRDHARIILQSIANKIEEHNDKIPELTKQAVIGNKISKIKIEVINKEFKSIREVVSKITAKSSEIEKVIAAIKTGQHSILENETKFENLELIVAQTYPTKTIESIYVSEEPSSPSKLRYTLLSAFLGLISSIIFTILYSEFKRERKLTHHAD